MCGLEVLQWMHVSIGFISTELSSKSTFLKQIHPVLLLPRETGFNTLHVVLEELLHDKPQCKQLQHLISEPQMVNMNPPCSIDSAACLVCLQQLHRRCSEEMHVGPWRWDRLQTEVECD